MVYFLTAKSLQSCPTLCNSIDGSPPGSAIPGILQARTLEWFAIAFSKAWKWNGSHSVMSNSSRPHGLQPTRLLRPWDSPGRSTGVGYHGLSVCSLLSCKDGLDKRQKWYGPNRSRTLRRGGKNTQKNYTKKIFTTQMITVVWSFT